MRIIAGQYRGRRIECPPGLRIRPAKSQLREALFNVIQHRTWGGKDTPWQLQGSIMADVYCGTGSLGFEGLSRGAAEAIFIDQSRESADLVRRMTEKLQANAHFLRTDARALPRAHKPCHLVVMDPPYGKGMILPTLESLHAGGWLTPGALVAMEHAPDEFPLPCLPQCYHSTDTRRYGNSCLSFLEYEG